MSSTGTSYIDGNVFNNVVSINKTGTSGTFLSNHSTSYLSADGNIDITRNGTASTLTIGSGSNMIVGGDFIVDNTVNAAMSFAVSASTFNGSGNFPITNSGTGTVDIASGAGDFDLSGNFIIEEDHRRVKRRIVNYTGFKEFESAQRTLAGIEVVNIILKDQIMDSKATPFKTFLSLAA